MADSADHNIPAEFEWLPDYDPLLDQIASTDVVDSEWTKLRDIIKYKITKNISMFLSEMRHGPQPPRPFSPHSLPNGGLRLPPFPPRKRSALNTTEAPVSYMSEQEANELKDSIFSQLHEFEINPPFTIQRLCELCVRPKKNYKSVGKYLRAVEKTLLVTSTWDAFPPMTAQEMAASARMSITFGATQPSAPPTPLFSPIPFLHDDARRSKSRSPPPSPLALTATAITEGHSDPTEIKGLGLVDELDDPSPGHMSDHPTALTAVTTVSPGSNVARPFLGSLEQRFVKSEGKDDTMGTDDAEEKKKP